MSIYIDILCLCVVGRCVFFLFSGERIKKKQNEDKWKLIRVKLLNQQCDDSLLVTNVRRVVTQSVRKMTICQSALLDIKVDGLAGRCVIDT